MAQRSHFAPLPTTARHPPEKRVEVQVLSSASVLPGRGRLPPVGARLRRPLAALSPLQSGPHAQHCDPSLRDLSATPEKTDWWGGCLEHGSARLWRRGAVARGSLVRGTARRAARDDDGLVNELVLDVALLVLALSLPAWLALSLAIVFGRVRYERSHREVTSAPLSDRAARRLVRRVRGRPRTEWGRWRRVTAVQRLERAHHRAVPRLIRPLLVDEDAKIAAAAIRTLGDSR